MKLSEPLNETPQPAQKEEHFHYVRNKTDHPIVVIVDGKPVTVPPQSKWTNLGGDVTPPSQNWPSD